MNSDRADVKAAVAARPQRELAHLPFDTAGCAASATRDDTIARVGEFLEDSLMNGGDRLRGK